MAVIQYTGIVNQIRGKLNGSVFNKARNVNTLQRKQQAPRRAVGYSSEPRNIFSNAQRSWKLLTHSQRTQWALCASNNPARDRFGELVNLSGYNQYVKAYILATYAETTPPATPYTMPAPPADVNGWDFSEWLFSISPLGSTVITVNNFIVSRDNNDPGFFFIFDVGLPTSEGVTVYYGRFSFVGAGPSPDLTTVSFSQNMGPRFPYPVQHQAIFARMRIVHAQSGAVVYEDVRATSANPVSTI